MRGKQQQIQEIIKCGKDPVYFINNYAKIQHPQKGLIPFDTYDFQDDCIADFQENRFTVVLKARQLGLSTLVSAYVTWMILFKRDKEVRIIATKKRVAQNIIRKIKTIVHNIPQWMLLTDIASFNKQEIEFKNGSKVEAIPTSDDAGRSDALSLLVVDEAAHIRNFDELYTGLYPTLAAGGSAIILSTPKGVGNRFHSLYVGALNGTNEFKDIRLPWDVHPDRDEAWFKQETSNMKQSQIAQEYMCDFLSSGETFVSIEDIEFLGAMVKPPIDKFAPDLNGWIWEYPLSQAQYIISADIASGSGKDYSTMHIIESATGTVVAEYKGKLPPDEFAKVLDEAGRRYNNALICPERNNMGMAVCMKLRDLQYPRLYYHSSRGAYLGTYIPEQELSNAGFPTQTNTRRIALAALEEIIRNKNIKIYSMRFYEELKTFVWVNNKPQAQKSYNDDLVMSMAIGMWLLGTSNAYSGHSASLNQAMLAGMSVSSQSPHDKMLPVAKEGRISDMSPIYTTTSEISKDIKKQEKKIISNPRHEFWWLF